MCVRLKGALRENEIHVKKNTNNIVIDIRPRREEPEHRHRAIQAIVSGEALW